MPPENIRVLHVEDASITDITSTMFEREGDITVATDGGRAADEAVSLFDGFPDPTILADFESGEPVIVRVNPAFERVFGYDADEVVGESANDVLVPPEQAAEARAIDEAFVAGEDVSREVRRETADGERLDFLFRSVAMVQSDDESLAYGVYTDITERLTYERNLAALHETARELMTAESTGEVLDVGVNAMRDILGYETNSIHRHDPEQEALVPEAATDMLGELASFTPGDSIAWRAFEAGEVVVEDDVRDNPDVLNPETMFRGVMILPLSDWGVLVAAATEPGAFDESDVSLAKILAATIESALRQVDREAELREREQSLARQNERLEEFASIVSHDLRTPLDLAGVHLELATEGEPSEDHLAEVASAHTRMSDLIDDILTWASEGDVVESPELVTLPALVRECWEDQQTDAATLNVETRRTVPADRNRLKQVLGNLLDNALAYAGDEPTVTVGDLEDADGVFVADDGPGIPEGEREAVFESGHTLSMAGTGFGLAIVRQIVEAHDWSITLTESDSGGARFEMRF